LLSLPLSNCHGPISNHTSLLLDSLPLFLFFPFHFITMPALTDKIFFPISIFVLNVTLAVFRFVLVSAVGACFAIYAKYGGEYAKSIGWVRSTGYRAMVRTFLSILKHKNAPGSVMWVLVVGFFITFAANFLDKGISNFVAPAFRLIPLGTEVMSSQQVMSDGAMFFGWSFIVPSNGNVTHIMEKALNSSLAIPYPREGEVYIPVISSNPTTCTDYEIAFWEYTVRNGTCGKVDMFLGDYVSVNPVPTSITSRSSNRVGFLMALPPGEKDTKNIFSTFGNLLAADISYGEESPGCSIQEDRRSVQMAINHDARISRTATTKCLLDSGNFTVLAITSTRFIGYRTNSSDDPLSRSNDPLYSEIPDELFSTMNQTLGSTMIPAPQPRNSSLNVPAQLYMEFRMANSSIDTLACSISNTVPDPALGKLFYGCVYATITMLQFKQNKDVVDKFGSYPGDADVFGDSVYISLEYSPVPTNETVAPLSTKNMTKDNVAVADFMASLGSNYFADFKKGLLFIQYDVKRRELGLEVPVWVLLAAGIIVVVSVCVWLWMRRFVGAPHTSSIYSIIRAELGSKSNAPVPRIMRFSYQPLMFEGVKLLPDKARTLPEDRRLL
ncbi:MAG: hypothetical protein J3Q66DRAFT_414781, partial [Benniella sp.]